MFLYLVAASAYLAENAATTTTDGPPIIPLLVAAAIAYFVYQHKEKVKAREQEREAKARARIGAMNLDEVHQKERDILIALRNCDRRVYDLAGIAEEDRRTTLFLVEGLVKSEDVRIALEVPEGADTTDDEVIPREPTLTEGSLIVITRHGRARLREPQVSELRIMDGDVNYAGPGGNVFSKSYVSNSFNTIASKYDEEMANALARLEEAVLASGSPDGAEHLQEFMNQARADQPNRVVLKSLFESIQRAVPTVTAMTDVVLKVKELIA